MDNKTKYASIFNVKAAKEADRTIEFTATKEIVDYDNEIVKVDGMNINSIKKNKSFLWSHQHSALPIGKITGLSKNGNSMTGTAQLTSEEEYPFGYTVYKLIKGGYINNVSIGFRPDFNTVTYKKDKNDNQVRIINDSTLIEVSAVNVGANRMATVSAKSIEDLAEKAFEENVLDQNELEYFYDELKKYENKNLADFEAENKELKEKIVKLEQKIEYLQEEEAESEEDMYDDLYKEFKRMKDESTDTTVDKYDKIIEICEL
jgi:HK97 family phage prohead protease